MRDNVQLVINTKTGEYSAGDVSEALPMPQSDVEMEILRQMRRLCLCQTRKGKINKTRAGTELWHDVSRTPAAKHVPRVYYNSRMAGNYRDSVYAAFRPNTDEKGISRHTFGEYLFSAEATKIMSTIFGKCMSDSRRRLNGKTLTASLQFGPQTRAKSCG